MFNVRHSEKDKLKGGLSVKRQAGYRKLGSGEGKPYTVCLLVLGGSVCKGFSAAENKGTPWEGGRISLTPIWSQPLIGYPSSSIPQITKALG